MATPELSEGQRLAEFTVSCRSCGAKVIVNITVASLPAISRQRLEQIRNVVRELKEGK